MTNDAAVKVPKKKRRAASLDKKRARGGCCNGMLGIRILSET